MEIRIRILVVFLLLIIDFSKSENLSELENEQRLTDCGVLELPKPKDNGLINITDKAWIVRVYNKKPSTIQTYDSLGTFISQRHVITSAQPIIDNDRKWSKDGVQWDGKCTNGTNHLKAPEVYLKNLGVRSEACDGKKCVEREFTAVKAWLLNMCNPDQFGRKSVMMIVEVQPTVTQYACLADKLTSHKVGDNCYAYGIKYDAYNDPASKNHLDYRLETIKSYSSNNILVDKYRNPGDRGGPLVMDFDGKDTVIGIGATPGFEDSGGYTYFFDVRKFREAICFTSGICEVEQTTTTTPSSTSTSPSLQTTSESTSSESPTNSESSTETFFEEVTEETRPRKRTKKPTPTPGWDDENDEDDEELERDQDDEEDEEGKMENDGGKKKIWELLGIIVGVLMMLG